MAEFSNPNQQGGQDNRSLIAMMVLVMAVVFGFQIYRAKMNPPSAAPATPSATQQAPAAAAMTATHAATATPAAAQASAVPAVPTVEASAETTTVIENELYRITFSNRGAEVTSWVLKRFNDSNGKPLDLVHHTAAELLGYPLSLYTPDGWSGAIASASRSGSHVTVTTADALPASLNGQAVAISGISDSSYNGTFVVTVTAPKTLTYVQAYPGSDGQSSGGAVSTLNGSTGAALSQALFVASASGALTAPATLTFKYSSGNLDVTKTFSFDETYVVHANVAVTRGGAQLPALLSWPGGFGDQDEVLNGRAYSDAKFDSDRNGSDDHLAPKKVTGGETMSGPFDWAGVSDPFFAAVFLPNSPSTAYFDTLNQQLDVAKTLKRAGFSANSAPAKALDMPILGVAMGSTSGPVDTRIFVGPKAIEVLKGIHAADAKVTLEPVLEFGFWGIIGKPLFLALHFIHSHVVANWGWSIVILTVIINILTLPFKVKTMQSALKMQRIQPQMDAIKEKYKKLKVTDPKRNDMNAEIMQLQKDNGVNMFGGCIPSLITFPLLMAFFYMVPRVVELRHATWFWLPDLQAPDPYHILPILMVVSMFLVQFYTPSPGVDPQQQKMMAFMMPAFSGYMTWTYGSGLALYWAVSNLIGIAQQGVMNRTSLGREMRDIAAKRARRKAPTIQGRK